MPSHLTSLESMTQDKSGKDYQIKRRYRFDVMKVYVSREERLLGECMVVVNLMPESVVLRLGFPSKATTIYDPRGGRIGKQPEG